MLNAQLSLKTRDFSLKDNVCANLISFHFFFDNFDAILTKNAANTINHFAFLVRLLENILTHNKANENESSFFLDKRCLACLPRQTSDFHRTNFFYFNSPSISPCGVVQSSPVFFVVDQCLCVCIFSGRSVGRRHC